MRGSSSDHFGVGQMFADAKNGNAEAASTHFSGNFVPTCICWSGKGLIHLSARNSARWTLSR